MPANHVQSSVLMLLLKLRNKGVLMKNLFKIILIIAFISLLISNCKNNDSNNSLSKMSGYAGYTNNGGQEYILLSHEFEKKNYAKVIDFINDFFDNNPLNENNLKILLLKIEAKEQLLQEINKKDRKTRRNTAKKFNFIIKNSKILYNYEELRTIWEKFPKTSYGKEAFQKYVKNIADYKEKVNSYEEFVDNINDKKLKNKLRFELSDLYLQNLIDLKGKKAKKLSDLYEKLLKTEYKNDILINSLILKYKITGNKTIYKREITTLLSKKNSNGMIANYLLADIEFIDNKLDESKKYFKNAKKKLKYFKEDDNIPLLFTQLERIYDPTVKNLKSAVDKKIYLIEKLLKYKKSFKDKNIAYIAGERVRIRKNPIISKRNVINTLNYGEKVMIIKRSDKKEKIEDEENYWYHIQLIDNTTGWVFGKYLSFYIY